MTLPAFHFQTTPHPPVKRSAKKFLEAAVAQGWMVQSEIDRWGNTVILAQDINAAFTFVPVFKYSSWRPEEQPTVAVEATFHDTGALSSGARRYITANRDHVYNEAGDYLEGADGNYVMTEPQIYVQGTYEDKLGDLLDALSYGPLRRAEAERKANEDKIRADALEARIAALKAVRALDGDSETGKRVRARLERFVRDANEPLDLSTVRDRDITTKATQHAAARYLGVFAKKALELDGYVYGDENNLRVLGIEEAAAAVADALVADLVDTNSYSNDVSKTGPGRAAAQEFIGALHPRYSKRSWERETGEDVFTPVMSIHIL